MKKMTAKQKLVNYMLVNGNSFTYTEMIKALLKIQRGHDYVYDWKTDRGYYATNFSDYGYMTMGCGDCGVYKDTDGKWKAKYYTKEEKRRYKAKNIVASLSSDIRFITSTYVRDCENLMANRDRDEVWSNPNLRERINYMNSTFFEKYKDLQKIAIDQIVKKID